MRWVCWGVDILGFYMCLWSWGLGFGIVRWGIFANFVVGSLFFIFIF